MVLNAVHQIVPDITNINAKMYQQWNNSLQQPVLRLYICVSIVLAVTTTYVINITLSNPTLSIQ